MKLTNTYIVTGVVALPDNAYLPSRKMTTHKSHESAVRECERLLSFNANCGKEYVIYRAVNMMRSERSPTQVCDIEDDGEVSCR